MNDFEGEQLMAEVAIMSEQLDGVHELLEALVSEESGDCCAEE